MTRVVAMTARHLDLLLPYEQEMFGTEAWSRRAYRDELADTRHRYYCVALDEGAGSGADGALLGWAGVRVISGEAEILTVGVVPTARRQGHARALLAALLDAARARGATVAFLEVRDDNPAAITLYESEGFGRVGTRRGYYAGGTVDAVVMRHDL